MKKIILAIVLSLAVLLSPTFTYTANARSVYSNYINARTLSSGLNIQPTAIYEPDSFSNILASWEASSYGITSIMLTPDANMNITLNGETQSFTDLFDQKIKGSYIPVLNITAQTVDGFIDMMNNVYYIADIVVVSDDLTVHEKISQDQLASICTRVYDLTDVELTSDRYFTWQYIAASNKYHTNILMFDATSPNLAVAAEYLSAMNKVCWAYTDDTTECVKSIAAGCTGVVFHGKSDFYSAIKNFSETGWAKAQNVAAHRGITAYANENSLMAVSAAVSEGATHVEIDIQVSADGEILLCHDNETTNVSSAPQAYFEPANSSFLRTLPLNDYSEKYGDSFPTLDEIIDAVKDTDLILIIELKLANAKTSVVKRGAIEKFLAGMERHPEMDGRWFCITFFRPYADQMYELAPEIPVGFLGAGVSGYENDNGMKTWDGEWSGMSNVSQKIAFMHKFNTVLDETYSAANDSTCQTYLARGYLQNGWTFQNLSHFNTKMNIATSDVMEQCAMGIKEICPTTFEITNEQLISGTLSVNTVNYCGWQQMRDCKIIVVRTTADSAQILLHYTESIGSYTYGLYSQLLTYKII